MRVSEAAEQRFAFGANWRDFLGRLTPERIESAEASLRQALGRNRLDGLRFLDVGSGSGLFSLAARRLGAEVVSFDYDPDSVACTRMLRDRFFPGDAGWRRVEQGSALDSDYLASLGTFDIVYSWGVLHHTGSLWRALDLVTGTVRPDGTLFVALYNDQGAISNYWRVVKKTYHRNAVMRGLMVILHAPYLVGVRGLVRLVTGRRRLERGMSLWYDMRDWLGGLPFEVASPGELTKFLEARGFVLQRASNVGRRHGCNEFVFTRAASA